MFRTSLSLIIVWSAQAFGSGVFLWLPAMMFADKYGESEIYVFMMVLSLIPIASIYTASYFVDTLGRRFLLMMSSLITGLSLLTFIAFPANARISIIVFYVIFGAYSLFMKVLRSVTYLYTPEVYSTSVRSTALAIMNVFDKIASIGQPMVMSVIIYTSFRLSMAIFGISYLLTFLFSMLLTKETANKPMGDTFSTDFVDNETGKSALSSSMTNPNNIA